MLEFSVIVAASAETRGIGAGGRLPWKLAEDMAHFRRVTLETPPQAQVQEGEGQGEGKVNAVIMGRNTWESIPRKFRPLKGRLNVVLSSRLRAQALGMQQEEGAAEAVAQVRVEESLEAAMRMLEEESAAGRVGKVFIMGGQRVYEEAMRSPRCAEIFLTEVQPAGPEAELGCDVFLPLIDEATFECVSTSETQQDAESAARFKFKRFARRLEQAHEAEEQKEAPLPAPAPVRDAENLGENVAPAAASAAAPAAPLKDATFSAGSAPNTEEMQYLDIVRDILENGVERDDRTRVGTLSKFGVQMRFNLRSNVFPLLTTKRVFWRGLAEELLWFIAGSTNAGLLQEKNIHIWDGNASREFLDKRGLTEREEGDLGPVYGFQWRHFGATYVDMHTDYTGQGVDQLMNCINTIKENPTDRRILMSAWNPADLDQMALPPCHMFCQFYVANGELSCQMYQRSADMGLGVPFNIASYALLTRLMAQVCGLQPGEFVHVIGDAHVYKNHVEPLREQLLREPRPFPTLHINPEKDDIDSFEFSDFTIEGYRPYKTIKMQMAV